MWPKPLSDDFSHDCAIMALWMLLNKYVSIISIGTDMFPSKQANICWFYFVFIDFQCWIKVDYFIDLVFFLMLHSATIYMDPLAIDTDHDCNDYEFEFLR